jgi:hypothetical protein
VSVAVAHAAYPLDDARVRGVGDSFRSFAGIASLFLAGVIALTWPLAARIGNALPGNLGDPLLNSIILGWNVQWLTGMREGGFWDAPIFHPHDNALAYSEHLIGQTLFVWPVFAASDNAVLTYNVALLASFALCGAACYLWMHALTGRRDVALVFAAALTFSPFRMGGQLPRLQMLAIGWLPLALWAIHRYGETTRVRYLAVVIASLTLLVLSNMYMLFLAALPVGLLMVSVLAAERERRWRLALGFAGGLAAVALLLLPVVQPYRALDARMGLVHDDDHTADYSAHLLSYASVHTSSPWLPWVRTEITGDQALYPGMVLLLPVVVLAVRRVRHGIDRSGRRAALLYGAIGGLALFLSFGPEIRTADADLIFRSPYAWLRDHVPGLAAVRAPGRFAAIVSLSLAALGALAMASLTSLLSVKSRTSLAIAAIGIIALEAWPKALRVEPMPSAGRPVDQQLYTWLARQPAAAMLELPASGLTAQVPLVELYHQYATLQHPHRLINGYSGFNPASAELFETHHSPFITLERLPEGVAYLLSLDVRYVVLHPHDYAEPGHAVEIIRRMQMLPEVAEQHEVDGHTIFVLAPRPQASARIMVRGASR